MAVVDLRHGDCRTVMAAMPAESVDAIVCDPPYGLSFMGKGWDHGVPGVEFWEAALRVLKPGGHLLAFGGTRTFHRLACAVEDAGFEIRDTIMYIYGSGFPKSLDVSKAIDKAAGADLDWREVPRSGGGDSSAHVQQLSGRKPGVKMVSDPATDAARQWQGWGTALKPAFEPVVVGRKPLIGTVAANVLAHGTGAMNIDGCRVGTDVPRPALEKTGEKWPGTSMDACGSRAIGTTTVGRWPANLIHDGSEEVLARFPMTTSGTGGIRKSAPGLFGLGGDGKANTEYGDSGSAARFFYCAKASKRDRDDGCDGMLERDAGTYAQDELSRANMGNTPDAQRRGVHNHHPTVKPTDLMRYLVRLVTPPGGIVLDPFMGSGSTGKAAVLEGFNFIGIELDVEYIEIARARIAHALQSDKQQTLAL